MSEGDASISLSIPVVTTIILLGILSAHQHCGKCKRHCPRGNHVEAQKEVVKGIGNPAGIGQGTGLGLRERERDGIGLGHYRLRATD